MDEDFDFLPEFWEASKEKGRRPWFGSLVLAAGNPYRISLLRGKKTD